MDDLPQIGDSFIEGTCKLMCPVEESKSRAECGLLYRFEATPESFAKRKLEPDYFKTVSSYKRPAAGTKWDPSQIRTPQTLLKTVRYLRNNILPLEELEKEKARNIYEFVHDRLRAVRQELVIQQVADDIRREILEFATVFYVVSAFKLSDLEYKSFDPQDNTSHIHICLNQLLIIYNRNDVTQQLTNECRYDQQLNARCIIEGINLIFNMKSLTELNRYRHLPFNVKKHPLIVDAISICANYLSGNYYALLKKCNNLHFILFCTLSTFIPEIQVDYLAHLSKATAAPTTLGYPVTELARMLFPFETAHNSYLYVLKICDDLNLPTKNKTILFSRKTQVFPNEAVRLMPRELWTLINIPKWHELIGNLFLMQS